MINAQVSKEVLAALRAAWATAEEADRKVRESAYWSSASQGRTPWEADKAWQAYSKAYRELNNF